MPAEIEGIFEVGGSPENMQLARELHTAFSHEYRVDPAPRPVLSLGVLNWKMPFSECRAC